MKLRDDISQQELENKVLNQKVKYKDKFWNVDKVEISNNDIRFYISEDKKKKNDVITSIGLIAFIKGFANFDDGVINEYVKSLSTNIKPVNPEEEKAKKEAEKQKRLALENEFQEEFKKGEETNILSAKNEAEIAFKNKDKTRYNKIKAFYDKNHYFKSLTDEAYYKTYERLLALEKQEKQAHPDRNLQIRSNGTIQSSYSGDLDELKNWLNDNIVSISCMYGDSSKDIFQKLEEQFGVKGQYNPTQTGIMLTARLKANAKETAPKEVFSWKIDKNIGANPLFEKGEMSSRNVVDFTQNKITSNTIIGDYLYNYKG